MYITYSNLELVENRKSYEIMYDASYHLVKIDGVMDWDFVVKRNMGKVLVFHSGHWGTEFLIPNLTEKDITVIKSINSVEVIFNQS